MNSDFSPELLQQAAPIRLLLSDVDGCLTDGGVMLHELAGEIVRFHVHDGYGIKMLQRAGIELALISGRDVPAVGARARSLGVREIHLGFEDKAEVVAGICKARGLAKDQIAAFGDDVPDLDLFQVAGLRCAPPQALPRILDAADYVTHRLAGSGAMREVAELLCAGKAPKAT